MVNNIFSKLTQKNLQPEHSSLHNKSITTESFSNDIPCTVSVFTDPLNTPLNTINHITDSTINITSNNSKDQQHDSITSKSVSSLEQCKIGEKDQSYLTDPIIEENQCMYDLEFNCNQAVDAASLLAAEMGTTSKSDQYIKSELIINTSNNEDNDTTHSITDNTNEIQRPPSSLARSSTEDVARLLLKEREDAYASIWMFASTYLDAQQAAIQDAHFLDCIPFSEARLINLPVALRETVHCLASRLLIGYILSLETPALTQRARSSLSIWAKTFLHNLHILLNLEESPAMTVIHDTLNYFQSPGSSKESFSITSSGGIQTNILKSCPSSPVIKTNQSNGLLNHYRKKPKHKTQQSNSVLNLQEDSSVRLISSSPDLCSTNYDLINPQPLKITLLQLCSRYYQSEIDALFDKSSYITTQDKKINNHNDEGNLNTSSMLSLLSLASSMQQETSNPASEILDQGQLMHTGDFKDPNASLTKSHQSEHDFNLSSSLVDSTCTNHTIVNDNYSDSKIHSQKHRDIPSLQIHKVKSIKHKQPESYKLSAKSNIPHTHTFIVNNVTSFHSSTRLIPPAAAAVLLRDLLLLYILAGHLDARGYIVFQRLADALDIRTEAIIKSVQTKLTAELIVGSMKKATTESKKSRNIRRLKVAGVAVGLGALTALSAGLAAPAIAAGFGALGIAGMSGTAAFLATAGGSATVASIFGAGTASLTGWKYFRRIGKIKVFQFDKLQPHIITNKSEQLQDDNEYHIHVQHTEDSSLIPSDSLHCNYSESPRIGTDDTVSLSVDKGTDSALWSSDMSDIEPNISTSNQSKLILKENNTKNTNLEDAHLSVDTSMTALSTDRSDFSAIEKNHVKKKGIYSNNNTHDILSESFSNTSSLINNNQDSLLNSSALLQTPLPLTVTICISGWLSRLSDIWKPWRCLTSSSSEIYALRWDPAVLLNLGDFLLNILSQNFAMSAANLWLQTTVAGALTVALMWPIALIQYASGLDNAWMACRERATQAGKLLADALCDKKTVGTRPVSLIGFSMGARVIHYCLLELRRKEAYHVVADVILIGSPVSCNKSAWQSAREVVSGRLVNVYSRADWLLGFLFRYMEWGITVAGLSEVKVQGIENVDVTGLIRSHGQYADKIHYILAYIHYHAVSRQSHLRTHIRHRYSETQLAQSDSSVQDHSTETICQQKNHDYI